MKQHFEISQIIDASLKKQITETILRTLPQWFGVDESLVEYINTVGEYPFFAAFDGDNCVGFFCGKIHHNINGDIYVCGVHPDFHGFGIGTQLCHALEKYFIDFGCEYIMVKTLSPLRMSNHYEATRKFYHAVGFKDFYTNHEIWGEDNPCLIMVKNLT